MEYYSRVLDLTNNPAHARWLSPLLLGAESCLCAFIIFKIPYTEIDWEAYMQQVSQYLDGERDYTLIKGGTGPLVYPAAHVFIYSILYKLTEGGKNILVAQAIFAWLYLATLTLVMACYRKVKAPTYLFPLLVLSKRLHSIFLLRLFNDCFAVGFLFIAIYAYQHRIWTVGSVAYSFGVGTKMSLLLAAPAIGTILLQALPFKRAVNAAFLMAQVQITIAFPFLPVNPIGYVSRAFEFSRQFLYKWTVNWRFLHEEAFLSREFTVALLAAHLSLLLLFTTTRWLKPSRQSPLEFMANLWKSRPLLMHQQMALRVTPAHIMTSVLSAMAIGLLCARSLHYQFYAYIAWSTPFLLWKSKLHPFAIYAVWAVQEWAWNVYPSTNASSAAVVGCLLIQVFGVWWGTAQDTVEEDSTADEELVGHKHVD
ncbi:MAG: hypothetical protein LQ337_000908 [Flavoplaca oasis]|nr:MAG: hypothetical protein LQ337_000908 [Flavoplaca oasis]